MFDFRECFILFLFAQAINYVMGGQAPACFHYGAFPTFRSHDIRHGCLYVESSEGGRGGLKRFVTVVARKFLKISC